MKEQENVEDIKFHGLKCEYSFLSNFYPAKFKIGDHTYQTNQHYFQSQKFVGTVDETEVIEAPDPKKAKSLGRKIRMKPEQHAEWQLTKQKVMLQGLRAKFSQNRILKQKLLKTGNRVLREHTGRDKYWGDGGKKFTGKNRLGVLLMQVREQLRKQ